MHFSSTRSKEISVDYTHRTCSLGIKITPKLAGTWVFGAANVLPNQLRDCNYQIRCVQYQMNAKKLAKEKNSFHYLQLCFTCFIVTDGSAFIICRTAAIFWNKQCSDEGFWSLLHVDEFQNRLQAAYTDSEMNSNYIQLSIVTSLHIHILPPELEPEAIYFSIWIPGNMNPNLPVSFHQ